MKVIHAPSPAEVIASWDRQYAASIADPVGLSHPICQWHRDVSAAMHAVENPSREDILAIIAHTPYATPETFDVEFFRRWVNLECAECGEYGIKMIEIGDVHICQSCLGVAFKTLDDVRGKGKQ